MHKPPNNNKSLLGCWFRWRKCRLKPRLKRVHVFGKYITTVILCFKVSFYLLYYLLYIIRLWMISVWSAVFKRTNKINEISFNILSFWHIIHLALISLIVLPLRTFDLCLKSGYQTGQQAVRPIVAELVLWRFGSLSAYLSAILPTWEI